MTMRLSDSEIQAVKSHYGVSGGEFDPDLEADLRSDSDCYGDPQRLDDRRRYRLLLKLWAGRKSGPHDVHTSHCCEIHGCKYSSKDCTVLNKTAPQDDLCEECEMDQLTEQLTEPLADKYAASIAHLDLESGNYILVDGEKVRFSVPPPNDEGNPEKVRIKAQYSDIVWAVKCAYIAGARRA